MIRHRRFFGTVIFYSRHTPAPECPSECTPANGELPGEAQSCSTLESSVNVAENEKITSDSKIGIIILCSMTLSRPTLRTKLPSSCGGSPLRAQRDHTFYRSLGGSFSQLWSDRVTITMQTLRTILGPSRNLFLIIWQLLGQFVVAC